MIHEFYHENHNLEKIIDYEIYTDGSCKGQVFGGWAFMVLNDSKLIAYNAGQEAPTTNQRMELLAAAKALEFIMPLRTANQRVSLYSDSAYLINCYTQKWYEGWLKNGWTNSSGKAVAHKDLWEQIIPFFNHWWFSFHKVKGHDTNYWNNRCDELAQSEAEKCKFQGRYTNGK